MKAICVTPSRKLELRDIPTPETPLPGHVLVDIAASAITHGDKFFLTRPLPGATSFSGEVEVYGSNGGGRIAAIGEGVPPEYQGKQVSIYKTLARSAQSVGLWCERAQVPYKSCLILPESVSARDYCGSFGNIFTVYAFLREIADGGHKGLIVTAGTSATGLIAASLTQRYKTPAIFLARSQASREALAAHGVEHVLTTTEPGFESRLGELAAKLGTTAVFDGVGGELSSRILPALPMNAEVFVYGFLGGGAAISLPAGLLLGKNLRLRRFANLESATATNPERMAEATKTIEGLIPDPLFETRIGKAFRFDEINEAVAYESATGGRALLVS